MADLNDNVSLDSLRLQILDILLLFSDDKSSSFLPDQMTMARLGEVARVLKVVGIILEERCKELLDRLILCFTRLCHDKRIDIRLRLELLEVIELRTLGWRTNQVRQ